MGKGLAKKYIKMAGGINKKAWALQRAANNKSNKKRGKPRTNTTTKRRSRSVAKRGIFSNKMVLGAALAIGAGVAGRQLGLNPAVSKVAVGMLSGNPIVSGLGIGEMIAGGGLTTGGGLFGSVGDGVGWL